MSNTFNIKTICIDSNTITSLSGVRVARSLVFCVVFNRSLSVLFLVAIMLSVRRFTDSDYDVGIVLDKLGNGIATFIVNDRKGRYGTAKGKHNRYMFDCLLGFNVTFNNISVISW